MNPIEAYHVKCPIKGCWLWTQGKNNTGYGSLWYGEKVQGAHRVSYQLYKGEIPDGKQVLHSCDVRFCVNPEHLFLGTQKENQQDMAKKGRTTSRFSEAEVRSMKEMRKAGKTLKAIGQAFGVRRQTIHMIVNGHTWSHIT